MLIELKRVEYSSRLSEETSAFVADVYVDGLRAGTARNSGQGGPTLVEPRALEERLAAYAKTLPPQTVTYGEVSMDLQPSVEMLIEDALTNYLVGKELRKKLLRTVVFRRDGKWFASKARPTPEALRQFRAKYPEATILNDLPWSEALALWCDASK